MSDYDPRYLEALHLFNEEEFFEAHDVWEELWADTIGADKKFYQGLIQLAISLFHFGNENYGGAKKLYESSRKYLQPYAPTHLGIDVQQLLDDHATCFAELLACTADYPSGIIVQDELVPKIVVPEAA